MANSLLNLPCHLPNLEIHGEKDTKHACIVCISALKEVFDEDQQCNVPLCNNPETLCGSVASTNSILCIGHIQRQCS